jgi:hypothetical protein
MKIKLLLVCAVLAVACVAIVVVKVRTQPVHKPPKLDPDRAALAYTTAPLDALYRAPEGKTPCESAYNAYKAEQDTSKQHGVKSHFTKLADRATFLTRCDALPKAAQPCMIPRYRADHVAECDKLRPSPEALSGLIEVRPQDPVPVPPSVPNPPPVSMPQ